MLSTSSLLLRRAAGLVGLPNVGKSTLFNALVGCQLAKTGNYPFCTIDANKSKAPVFDERLRKLAAFVKTDKIVDVEIDLMDVAGLIEGASKGAGLGNKFLNDVRSVSVILQVVRCFESAADGFDAPDPIAALATIENELILADIQSVERKLTKLRNRGSNDIEVEVVGRVHEMLTSGGLANPSRFTVAQQQIFSELQLLTAKPTLYVLNVDDQSLEQGNSFSKQVEEKVGVDNTVRVSCLLEQEMSLFGREEKLEFLKEYGAVTPSTDALTSKVQKMLGFDSFFTVGPKMAHAWSMKKGSSAREAAKEIHSSFFDYFVKGRRLQWNEYISFETYAAAECQLKVVGFDDVLQDGDVFVVEHKTPSK